MAEEVLDLGRIDAGGGARLDGMVVEAWRHEFAPLLAPRPGDQAVEGVRGCRAVVLAAGPGGNGDRAAT